MRRLAFFFVTLLLLSCNNNNNKANSSPQDDKDTENVTKTAEPKQNILFFGNSLTAGYGLEDQEQAFPALIQQKIDSLELPYNSINGGLSGETSAGGNERIDWLLKQPISIFVLELGANDGLRGVSTESTYKNLSSIVEKVKAAYPECKLVLAGMMIPPSMGTSYSKDFRALYPKLADEHDMTLVPFLLDKVAGIEKLNQGDGIHPTDEGQKIVAHNVWQVLQPLL